MFSLIWKANWWQIHGFHRRCLANWLLSLLQQRKTVPEAWFCSAKLFWWKCVFASAPSMQIGQVMPVVVFLNAETFWSFIPWFLSEKNGLFWYMTLYPFWFLFSSVSQEKKTRAQHCSSASWCRPMFQTNQEDKQWGKINSHFKANESVEKCKDKYWVETWHVSVT